MHARRTLSFVIAAAFAATVQAQVCSGGSEGGMDATGNQCNEIGQVIAQAADDPDAMREQGLQEYAIGHYAAAVAHFRSAATSGDLRSAEILVLMYHFGPTLYGDGVAADAAESTHWAEIVTTGRPLTTASSRVMGP